MAKNTTPTQHKPDANEIDSSYIPEEMRGIAQEAEHSKIIHYFQLAALASLTVLGIGTVFYHIVEKLSWLDSVYFCIITLTTIGYGDITPHTSAGKIFTIFYVITGLGIIAAFINLTVKRALLGRRRK